MTLRFILRLLNNPKQTSATASEHNVVFGLRLLAVAVLSSLLMIKTSYGQDNVGDDSTVVYPASYFAEFSPVTAQDMIDRLPGVGSASGGGSGGPPRGFSGQPSNGGRGFGGGNSGGNEILINGKRTAGKSNQTSGQLNRITANQVEHIAIIRGTSGDLDVRGSGQVINVVLFEDLSSTSISYELSAEQYRDDTVEPGGSISLSGQTDRLSYVFSAVARPFYDRQIVDEESVLGDFSLNDLIHEERVREQTQYEFSSNLSYDLNAKSSVRLNALYAQNDNPTTVFRNTTNLRVTPNVLATQREDIPGERDNWEIGGDYEYRRGNGNRFKVLFIANENDRSTTRERFDILSSAVQQQNLFLDTASTSEERIVRGSYTFDIVAGQDVEFGVEAAQTTLSSSLALGLPSDTGTPSPAFGGLVPQTVSNANSRVEEIRYEPFVIHNWILNPKMSLESTLLYETSEISQSGDVSNTRKFNFIKPKLDFRYDLTPQLQLRGTIERVVNQLSFNDFVAANDDQDDDANTQAGNANLRQESQWNYDLNAEYRLPNDVGVLTANVFYRQHSDVIERVDVSPSESDLQSANGNIGDGEVWGFRGNASVRMRMIGLPNLRLTASLTVEDSSIEDPFLGIDRRFQFQARGFNSFGFRHDIPKWKMNWGADYRNRHDDNILRFDIDDIEAASGDPFVTVFGEYINKAGITFRIEARGVTNNEQCRERSRFVGRISTGVLEELEKRCTGSGGVMVFGVTGAF